MSPARPARNREQEEQEQTHEQRPPEQAHRVLHVIDARLAPQAHLGPVHDVAGFMNRHAEPHAQRAAGHANALMVADAANPEVAATLAADADRLRTLLASLKQGTTGTQHSELVADLEADAGATLLSVNSIVAGTHPLMLAKEAASNIARDSVPLLARSAAVTPAISA